MSKCTRHHSQYFYHATAYGLAAHVERPYRYTIPTQASTILGVTGGRGHDRVEKFQFERMISFASATVEVGGSFDECHNRHTSYSSAIIEGLNIMDMVTADVVVARMAVYGPVHGDKESETTYDITGSHFENLKIAGHRFDVKLATHVFHEHDTYSKIAGAHHQGKTDDWLMGNGLGNLSNRDLEALEDEYHALGGISEMVNEWKQKDRPKDRGHYPFSPLNHVKVEDHAGKDSELRGFGSIICVPKFGVVRLAELLVNRNCRTLTMLRVDMCSTGTGGSSTGGVSGGGTKPTGGG